MQVLEVEVALANGTLALVNAQSHPHLFPALQVHLPGVQLSQNAEDWFSDCVSRLMLVGDWTMAKDMAGVRGLQWQAQAGVGRLGIITRLKLPVVPQAVVKRSLDMTSIDEFAKQLTQVQEDYVAAKAAGTAGAIEQSFLSISEVQVWTMYQCIRACVQGLYQ